MKVDVVIVGARCAGASTALLLARAGARVWWSIADATAPTRCRRTP
jgi:glycine/D-amino acid oxidase-like deaminating enzyme